MDCPKDRIIKIIKNNDINKLKTFIENNKVKTKDYDLLTLAIEKNAPFSFIKILLEQYNSVNYIFREPQYKTYNKNDTNVEKLEYQSYKKPLCSAIAKNNFKLADYLIKYHNAEVNCTEIVWYLYNDGKEHATLINKKNITYMLTNKLFEKSLFYEIVYDILKFRKSFLYKYLEIIFSYTSLCNDKILTLLYLYYRKTSISNNHLLEVLKKDNIINEQMFIFSLESSNFEITKLLFKYNITTRNEWYEYINKYYLADYIINRQGYKVIDDILSYKNLNFSLLNFENILLKMINFEKFEVIKPILYDIIYHPCYQFNDINLELLFKEACYNDEGLSISYYIIDLIYCHPLFNLNKLNLENIFINIVNSYNNKFLIKELVEKLLQYNYDFSIINFENILKEISHNPYGDEFMEYFLNLIEKYQLCSLDNVNFKSVLIDAYKNNEHFNPNIFKYLLKLIFNMEDGHFENINVEELKQCDTKFLCMIINIIIENGNYDLLKYLLENRTIKSRININIKDINDNYPIITAFHAATHLAHSHSINNIKVFEYLIEFGASINVVDSDNNSLLIIALYVEDYLFINYILKQQVNFEKAIININSDPIVSFIFNDDLENIQTLFPEINKNNIISDDDYIPGLSGDENYDFYNRIKNSEIQFERKTSYDDNFIEELLKSDNVDEEFNKFISLEDDIKNLNCNDFTNMNLKPDTTIIRCDFPPLILSYLLDKKKLFKYFLDHCDINEVDTLQYSVIHYAVLKEDIDTIQLLLKIGADINLYQNKNGRGHSAFDIAIAIGNNELFNLFLDSGKVLLDQPNQKKETPLTSVINHRLLELETKKKWMKKLIDKGANVDLINVGEYCALAQTVKCHSLSLMKFLVEECNAKVDNYDQNNDSPLIFAILEEDIKIIQYLIDHGADVNHVDEEKQTPLEIAIRWGSVPSVKILLENGADVNMGMLDYNGKDISLLSYALQVHEPEIANYLIKYGADWNYKNSKNETLYDIAYEQVDKDNLEVMKILADHDIDGFKEKIIWDTIKYEDENHITFFKFLIENKININIRDKDGNTPLGFAIISNNEELVDYLLKNNADISNINNQNKNIYELALDNIDDNNSNNKNIESNNDCNENNNNINTKNYCKSKSILQKLIDIDIKYKLKIINN
jgi:ankyrin repeat protein